MKTIELDDELFARLQERMDEYSLDENGVINHLLDIVPKWIERYENMNKVAKEYYMILQCVDGMDSDEKRRLNDELDMLSQPYSDNQAYHAFLEMERMAAFKE